MKKLFTAALLLVALAGCKPNSEKAGAAAASSVEIQIGAGAGGAATKK
jgi:hypothetical protein